MTITVYLACALFAWIFVLSGMRRLPGMRREPERLVVWLMFLAFALVFTVGSSPLRRHLDGFASIAEFSTWLAQSLVVITASPLWPCSSCGTTNPHRPAARRRRRWGGRGCPGRGGCAVLPEQPGPCRQPQLRPLVRLVGVLRCIPARLSRPLTSTQMSRSMPGKLLFNWA
jgi:hypothetical protein